MNEKELSDSRISRGMHLVSTTFLDRPMKVLARLVLNCAPKLGRDKS